MKNIIVMIAAAIGIAVGIRTLFPGSIFTPRPGEARGANPISRAADDLFAPTGQTVGTGFFDWLNGSGTSTTAQILPNPRLVLAAGGDFDDGSGGLDPFAEDPLSAFGGIGPDVFSTTDPDSAFFGGA